MATKVNGVIDTSGFDTLGGIAVYKVVTSQALTTAADGSEHLMSSSTSQVFNQ